jgi:acetyltransferase-like isoleucine patch superfamily enzyme
MQHKNISFIRWFMQHLRQEYKKKKDLYKVLSRNPTVTIEEDVQILNRKKLFLGNNIHIGKGTILHCGGGAWCNYGGSISIGDNVYIGPYGIFLGAGEIEIQRRCHFGPGVMLIAQSLHPDTIYDETLLDAVIPPHKFGKITLEEGVLVGAGAMILEGVTIGRGSAISAGSLVQKDVPPNSYVITGKTAKFIDKNSPLFRPK